MIAVATCFYSKEILSGARSFTNGVTSFVNSPRNFFAKVTERPFGKLKSFLTKVITGKNLAIIGVSLIGFSVGYPFLASIAIASTVAYKKAKASGASTTQTLLATFIGGFIGGVLGSIGVDVGYALGSAIVGTVKGAITCGVVGLGASAMFGGSTVAKSIVPIPKQQQAQNEKSEYQGERREVEERQRQRQHEQDIHPELRHERFSRAISEIKGRMSHQ